jgi:glycosyltransferase involved in cell wall biosynthesis
MNKISVRLGLQQRVLPEYRAAFFDALAAASSEGLSVFAGQPQKKESITTFEELQVAKFVSANNLHLLQGGFYSCVQTNFSIWLEQWQPGALIVEANPRYLSTPNAIRWMHAHRRPVIGWGLGAPKSRGLESALRKRFLYSLDAVISYSKTGAEQYIAAGIDPKRVFIAPNAVAPMPTHPPLERPDKYIDDRPVLLYVGRLQTRKRLDVLIHACAALPDSIQPRLILVGDGPDRSRLEHLAAQVYPRTEFPGSLHGAALHPYYAAADLFILPGTGGLAVQQAMANALPVIVGEADGTQVELVREENGWIVSDPGTEALAFTIQEALQDLPRLRRMGLASYHIVANEINLERMVAVFVEAVNSVL